jgi:transcriptional regulator with XRE-family HTH domain
MRESRERAGITKLGKAAKSLGLEVTTLSAIEEGKYFRTIPLAMLAKSARLYSVTVDYLLGLAERPDNDWAELITRYAVDLMEERRKEAISEALQIFMREEMTGSSSRKNRRKRTKTHEDPE